MSRHSCNVLISSAGRRVGLMQSFKASLQQLGLRGEVLATDMSRLSSASQLADRSFLVPKCTSEDFVPAMLDICQANDVQLLVPTIDTELHPLATSRDAFAAIGTTVAVSSPEVIAIGADKRTTHAWLLDHVFPTVRQASVEDVLADAAAWPFPLITKPVDGSASKGVAVVQSRDQLVAATGQSNFIVQSIAPGSEHTVDFLVDRSGRCTCVVPRMRLETRAGEVSKGMIVLSDRLEQLVRAVAEALPGAYGALNIQIFWDEPSGRIAIIEINPRFAGGFPLTWEAGGHFPRWIVEEILGLPSTASRARIQDGLVMLRYDSAVFVERSHAGV